MLPFVAFGDDLWYKGLRDWVFGWAGRKGLN
jgi:hypothetical protein